MRRIEDNETSFWLDLVERYFNAATTEEEEKKLRLFLSSPQAEKDNRFDEARAVLGFMAMGKKFYGEKLPSKRIIFNSYPIVPKLHRHKHLAYWSIAAMIAIISLVSLGIIRDKTQNVCVAYISGKKVTNPQVVKETMTGTLRVVTQSDDRPTVEKQLTDIFHTIE